MAFVRLVASYTVVISVASYCNGTLILPTQRNSLDKDTRAKSLLFALKTATSSPFLWTIPLKLAMELIASGVTLWSLALNLLLLLPAKMACMLWQQVRLSLLCATTQSLPSYKSTTSLPQVRTCVLCNEISSINISSPYSLRSSQRL